MYPIRGIRSQHSLNEIELSPFGVKYDREIVIVDADDLKHVTTNNYKTMACLFQQLVEG